MTATELILTIIIGLFLIYSFLNIDHFHPFKHLKVKRLKKVDYEIYKIEKEPYLFHYKNEFGIVDMHVVKVQLISIHSTGKIFIKGFDSISRTFVRFDVSRCSKMFDDNLHLKIWYPKKYFKDKALSEGKLVKAGHMEAKL